MVPRVVVRVSSVSLETHLGHHVLDRDRVNQQQQGHARGKKDTDNAKFWWEGVTDLPDRR